MRTLFLDKVDSTNNYLKKLSAAQNPWPFLAVYAYNQFSGRGRLGRVWESKPGENLTVSYLFEASGKDYQLALVCGYSALELCNYYGINIKLKWPNDLYYKNHKLGGILVEQQKNKIIAGLGINLNQSSFSPDIDRNPSSLKLISGKHIEIKEALHSLSELIEKNFYLWQNNKNAYIQEKVSPKIAWLGKNIQVDYPNGKTIRGKIKGLNPDGFLVIEPKNSTEVVISAGDIKLCLQE